jgi:hypothetical protein
MIGAHRYQHQSKKAAEVKTTLREPQGGTNCPKRIIIME